MFNRARVVRFLCASDPSQVTWIFKTKNRRDDVQKKWKLHDKSRERKKNRAPLFIVETIVSCFFHVSSHQFNRKTIA